MYKFRTEEKKKRKPEFELGDYFAFPNSIDGNIVIRQIGYNQEEGVYTALGENGVIVDFETNIDYLISGLNGVIKVKPVAVENGNIIFEEVTEYESN